MTEYDRDSMRRRLADSRAELMALVRPLTPAQWDRLVVDGDEPWTAADMLRHLAAAEKGMVDLIVHIRDGGQGASADFDLNRWNRSRVGKARALTPAELIEQMAAQRERLLALLDQLTDAELSREGRHGSGRSMSIAAIIQLIGDHERAHAAQIRQAVAS